MSASDPKRVLDESQFIQLRDLIYEASGLYFTDQKRYLLQSRLQTRLAARGLRSFEEYLYFLKLDPSRREEMNLLFNEVTTNETSFYRNPAQMQAFEEHVLPELIERKKQLGLKRLKLWSAGCSSGEEPYSMAILINKVLGRERRDWQIDLIATDISTEMLDHAKAAVYSDYAMRSLPDEHKRSSFTRTPDNCWRLSDAIKRDVRFDHLNFTDDARMRLMRNFDVVFCRNVLIYFDLAAKKRFVSHFYDALVPDGFLFLGHAESLHKVSRAFRVEHFPGALVYRKE